MPDPSVLPSPLPSALLRRFVPDEAQLASYLAASLSKASFSLRVIFAMMFYLCSISGRGKSFAMGGLFCHRRNNAVTVTFACMIKRLFTAFALIVPSIVSADVVGEVGVDWLGNDLIIEAFADPAVEGVTCHVTYFERGIIDRLQKGNWFEDPSNSSISCRQTGPIKIGEIDRSKDGEDVFRERRSIIFKTLRIKRIYDAKNETLIYISHARDVQNGSAKMSMSTVPLFQP